MAGDVQPKCWASFIGGAGRWREGGVGEAERQGVAEQIVSLLSLRLKTVALKCEKLISNSRSELLPCWYCSSSCGKSVSQLGA